MNFENTLLFLIGLITFVLLQSLMVWINLHGWIQEDCKEQGPEFIRDNLTGRLLFAVGVMMAVLCVLVLMDALYFRQRGILVNAINKVPLLGEWGERNMLALPLWLGALGGVFAGSVIGLLWALSKSTKCRRVLRALFKK